MKTGTRTRTSTSLALAAAVAIIAAACGGSTTTADSATVFETIEEREHLVVRLASAYESFEEALPNARWVVNGEERTWSDVFVVGKVESVEPGRSFAWVEDDETDSIEKIELPFGDDKAEASTIHITVAADDVIAADGVKVDREVTFGIAVGPETSVADVRAEFEAYGTVAALLVESAVFDYQEGLYGIVEGGKFLGTSADGVISFPLLEEDARSGDAFLAGEITFDALVERAPSAPIVVNETENGWERQS